MSARSGFAAFILPMIEVMPVVVIVVSGRSPLGNLSCVLLIGPCVRSSSFVRSMRPLTAAAEL